MDRHFPSRRRQAGSLAVAIRLAAVLFALGAVGAMGAGAGWGAALPGDSSQAPQTFGVTLPQHAAKSLKPARLTPSEQAGLAPVAVSQVRPRAIASHAVLQTDALYTLKGATK